MSKENKMHQTGWKCQMVYYQGCQMVYYQGWLSNSSNRDELYMGIPEDV